MKELSELNFQEEPILLKEDFDVTPRLTLKLNKSELIEKENSKILFALKNQKETVEFNRIYQIEFIKKILKLDL